MKHSHPLNLWWVGLRKPTFILSNIILLFGLLTVFSVGYSASEKLHISSITFFAKQVVFCIIGYFLMFVVSCQDQKTIIKISRIGFVTCIILLVAVLFLGGSIKGAKRWIHIGFMTIQPSEILKPFYVIILSYLFTIWSATRNNKYIIACIVLHIIACVLFFLEPDFGMILTFTTIISVLFYISHVHFKRIAILGIVGLVITLTVALSLEHVRFRIKNFFHSNQGDNYQTDLAIDAIKDGGFFGKGFGESKLKFILPDSHNDFIFAIICEEFGSIIALLLILCYLLILYENFLFVLDSDDELKKIMKVKSYERHAQNSLLDQYIFDIVFSRNVTIATVMLIFFETSVNSAVSLHLIPTKGMTLPLVSYGGSSLLSHLILLGFLLAFTRKKYRFYSNIS